MWSLGVIVYVLLQLGDELDNWVMRWWMSRVSIPQIQTVFSAPHNMVVPQWIHIRAR